jgi:hypothetical protein
LFFSFRQRMVFYLSWLLGQTLKNVFGKHADPPERRGRRASR